MREERNSEFGHHRKWTGDRMKARLERRNFIRRQREERIAWMKTCRKRQHHHRDFNEGKEWFGIFIILIGLIWLGKAFLGPYPDWLFSWQSLMIAIGLALGFASRFRNKIAYALILIGFVFMAKEYIFPEMDLGAIIWPVIIIGIGILFIVKKREEDRIHRYLREHPEEFTDWREHWHRDCFSSRRDPGGSIKEEKMQADATNPSPERSNDQSEVQTPEAEKSIDGVRPSLDDWINITNVFSGTRRTIISKKFKGGDIANIFGGTEIDLSRADISGTVTLDVTNIMGGISLAIPPNWQVIYKCTCIMGGTDDRRRSGLRHDPNKTLILTGVVLMAGVEIRDML